MPYIENTTTGAIVWHDPAENYKLQQDEVDIGAEYPATPTLAQAKAAQVAVLQSAYQAAISAPVTFKNAAGVTSAYAFGNTLTLGGANAQDLLTQIVDAGAAAWKVGVWFDTNGVAQAMTFADLQSLVAAIEAAETPDEQNLMTKIAQVQAAATVAQVQSVTF